MREGEMYYYVLTSGRYSDYGIEGVIASIEPVDIEAKLAAVVVWLNEQPGLAGERWYVPEEIKAAAFAAVGLTFVEYEETNYDFIYTANVVVKGRVVDTNQPPRWVLKTD